MPLPPLGGGGHPPPARSRAGGGLLLVLCLLSAVAAAPVPSVFVIGDSISMHYDSYLAEYLRGVATYDRKRDDGQTVPNLDVPTGANGGDSRMVLAYLTARADDAGFRPDYLVINAGLHDIKRDPQTDEIQVDAAEYRRNLVALHALSRRIGAQLVWITTTAVEDERHNSQARAFRRYDRDRAAYDLVAREVMSRHGVPIIDLYTFTKSLPGNRFIDHVHYDEAARALQAAFIAGSLQQIFRHVATLQEQRRAQGEIGHEQPLSMAD